MDKHTGSMLQAIKDNLASLDEALLSNVLAWMRRCKDDGLTGGHITPALETLPWKWKCTWTVPSIVESVTLCGAICAEVYLVLQRVLQRYAALSLVKDSDDPAEACLNTVIAEEPSSWPELFRCTVTRLHCTMSSEKEVARPANTCFLITGSSCSRMKSTSQPSVRRCRSVWRTWC